MRHHIICLTPLEVVVGILPHSAQTRDPSYRMAEAVVILDQPSTQPAAVESLVRFYPNFILRLLRSKRSLQLLQIKTTSHGTRPPTEDNLKILKVEYLSNNCSDLIRILNLCLCHQSEVFK